jgi:hypothetical protein
MDGCYRSVLKRLIIPVVFLSGMDHQILLFGLDADFMKAFAQIGPVRRISQAVLIAQVLFNLGVNFFHRLLAGNLKQPSARSGKIYIGQPCSARIDISSL